MPGPSAKPTACAVVRKPIQRPCLESGIVSPTIDIAAGIKPESNMPSTKRMGMNSSGTFTNARSRLVTIKPVIIRVTQPIRNISATVIDFDGLTGEAVMGLALTTFSRGTLTVSGSRTAVFICCILSDPGEVSDNTLAKYPLPSLTLVVLFPSLVYDLQFASNL